MNKMKIITNPDTGDKSISFKQALGSLEEGEDVNFSFNLAPEELDGAVLTKAEVLIYLDEQIKYYQGIKKLVKALNDCTGETDFYWSDEDLMLRINTTLQ